MSWLTRSALCVLVGCGSAAHEAARDGGAEGAANSTAADGGVAPGDADTAHAEHAPSDGGAAAQQPNVTPVTRDAGAETDAAASGAGHAADSEPDDAGPAPSFDCSEPAAVAEPLVLEVASEPPVGLPFALSVSTRSGAALSGEVQVCAGGQRVATLQLYRGRGSVSLRVAEPGPLLLQAHGPSAYGASAVEARVRPVKRFEAAVDAGAQTYEWTADEDIVVEGVQRLAAGDSLTVGPGTRVLFGENAILSVAGALRIQGTADAPVLFTRAGAAAWGGVYLLRGAQGSFDHVWFVAGGGDVSRAFGHSNSQPVVFVDSSTLEMRGGGLIDNIGKAFGSNRATLDLDGILISRCDTGGQFQASQLMFKHLHVLELPDADGRFDDDDNDGFYVYHSMSDDAGVQAVIEDSVFAVGEDDAIDQNGAQLRLERVWIEGFRHEGVACSSGRDVTIRDSVVRGCEQGIEAGYGAPHVHVENSLVTGNSVGLRVGDSYDWETSGSLDATQSLVVGNDENVRNYVVLLMGPLPDALRVRCSVVDDVQLAGSDGNVLPPAGDAWRAEGCSSEALLDAQQCGTALAGPVCR
jgi:hypothetical protein